MFAPLPASSSPTSGFQELIQELAPVVPAPKDLPGPSAPASTTPEAKVPVPTAAASVPLPEPVAKTIDSVVSVATGSPLYVQVITVFALLAAGFLYFRFIGSKARRSLVRSHK
ncbi:hypothetical protein [Arthrobacter cupressi]|uniref:hypothetical protein n=1 Tax=Arthrobacter cupressi TaxID=1045773 RepID=UPI0015872684|nr:hypothetical protein [Arthrobacter cupressi]